MPENLIAKFGTNKCLIVKAVSNDKIKYYLSVKSRGDKCYLIVSGSIGIKLGLQIAELIQIYLKKKKVHMSCLYQTNSLANSCINYPMESNERSYIRFDLKFTDVPIRKALVLKNTSYNIMRIYISKYSMINLKK